MFKWSNLKPKRILLSASKHHISLAGFQIHLEKKPQREPNHFSCCFLIPDIVWRASPTSFPTSYTPNLPEQVSLQPWRGLKPVASHCSSHICRAGKHDHYLRLRDKKNWASYAHKATQNHAKDSALESHLWEKPGISQTTGLEGNVRDVGLMAFYNKTMTNSA